MLCRHSHVPTGLLALLLAVSAWPICLPPPALAEWPFQSPEATVITPGDLEAHVSLEAQDFLGSAGTVRYSIPTLDLRVGLGEIVDLRMGYSLYYLTGDSREDGFGSGDITIFSKIGLLRPTAKWPALALDLGVKLPNADETRGLGTDETDFYARLVTGLRGERVSLDLSAGLGILGDTDAPSDQEDVLLYGAILSGWFNRFVGAGLEAQGSWSPDEHLHWVRAALLVNLPKGRLELFAGGGLNAETPDWAAGVGYTVRGHLFDLPAR